MALKTRFNCWRGQHIWMLSTVRGLKHCRHCDLIHAMNIHTWDSFKAHEDEEAVAVGCNATGANALVEKGLTPNE